MSKKKLGPGGFDGPGEITIKTKAAKKLIDAAETMGILGRLLEQLSRRCGTICGSKANSPCQGERRKDKWRGEEDRRRSTESSDRIDMDLDGESSRYDQMAQQIIDHLEQKPKPKRRSARYKKSCRDE